MQTVPMIRPVERRDLSALENFAKRAGRGVTTLQPNKEFLLERIERSERTFSNYLEEDNPLYLFILEDTMTQTPIGTCTITPRTLGIMSGYYYQLSSIVLQTKGTKKREIEILRPYRYPHYATELGGLYLLPEMRSKGIGKFLSLSRFLYIALEPDRFEDELFAELRGYINEEGRSPFWEGVGRFFLDMDYEELQLKMALNEREAVYAMAPYPIFTPLLPKAVRDVVARSHQNTQAAQRMLETWGFYFSGMIDIADGGPRYSIHKEGAYGVSNSRSSQITLVNSVVGEPSLVVARLEPPYRATIVPNVRSKNGELYISQEIAKMIDLHSGDRVLTLFLDQHEDQ